MLVGVIGKVLRKVIVDFVVSVVLVFLFIVIVLLCGL